jgi:addiction module RelE/StbE family toxin
MKYRFVPEFSEKLTSLSKRDKKTFTKVHKQIALFLTNPKHPSLRTHKLKGNLGKSWSISVDSDYRIIYEWEGDIVVFFDFGTHKEVYGKFSPLKSNLPIL